LTSRLSRLRLESRHPAAPGSSPFRLASDGHFRLTAAAEAGKLRPSSGAAAWCSSGSPARRRSSSRSPTWWPRRSRIRSISTSRRAPRAPAWRSAPTCAGWCRGSRRRSRWPLAHAAITLLSKVGANLNQLVKLAHPGRALAARADPRRRKRARSGPEPAAGADARSSILAAVRFPCAARRVQWKERNIPKDLYRWRLWQRQSLWRLRLYIADWACAR